MGQQDGAFPLGEDCAGAQSGAAGHGPNPNPNPHSGPGLPLVPGVPSTCQMGPGFYNCKNIQAQMFNLGRNYLKIYHNLANTNQL